MPAPSRRWFAFRLRTLLVVVAVLSIPLAWVAHTLDWIKRRQDAIGLDHLGVLSESPSMSQRWYSKPKPFNFWIAHKLLGMYPSRWLGRDEDSPLTREQAEALFPEAIIKDSGLTGRGRFLKAGRLVTPAPFPDNTSSYTESND